MSSEELKALPSYFPTTKPACKEVSAKFFYCFSTKGKKVTSNDLNAARRGLAECQDELSHYMACMEKE